MRLWEEKPGVISEKSVWCIIYDGCYLHINESLFSLFLEVLTEYKDDKHLVGY